MLDVRLGENLEVIANDMPVCGIRRRQPFDDLVIIGRTNGMTEIEGNDVKMLQRKIAGRLADFKLRYDQRGKAQEMAVCHAVPKVIHRS